MWGRAPVPGPATGPACVGDPAAPPVPRLGGKALDVFCARPHLAGAGESLFRLPDGPIAVGAPERENRNIVGDCLAYILVDLVQT